MQLGATWAGLAIEHSMLGAAHALANPLGARCGLAHGLAVGLALPAVVRFNAGDALARTRYADLARSAGLSRSEDEHGAVRDLLAFLRRCFAGAGLEESTRAHGVRPEDVPALAEEASRQWTAQFNPRPVGQSELEALLAASR
jgi:alcohol dehydrogenase